MAKMRSPILNNSPSQREVDTTVDQKNEQVLAAVSNLVGGLSVRLDRISAQMVSLSTSLQSISQTVTTNAFLERQKEAIEQERERRAAQLQLREGQESLVERKIQNATIEPAQKAAVKAQSSLKGLMGFFTLLLTGWLGPKIISGIQSASKFTIDKLREAKQTFDKVFESAKGIFSNIGQALTNIVGSITRTTARVSQSIRNGVFKRPIQFLRDFIQGTIDKVRGVFKRGDDKGGDDNNTGGNNTTNNSQQQSFSPTNLLFNFGKSLTTNPVGQTIFGAGANMFNGASPGQAVSGAASGAAFVYGVSKLPVPFPVKLGASIFGFTPLSNLGQNIFSQAQQGSLYEGMDFSKMFSAPAVSTSANVQPVVVTASTRAASVGPTPEPETNVVVTAGGQQGQQEVPTGLNPSANTIPDIASSNIDNFYVYYSMANYNVVV